MEAAAPTYVWGRGDALRDPARKRAGTVTRGEILKISYTIHTDSRNVWQKRLEHVRYLNLNIAKQCINRSMRRGKLVKEITITGKCVGSQFLTHLSCNYTFEFWRFW